MYTVLTGLATPDLVAMTSGPQPDWAEVITEDCPESQAVSRLLILFTVMCHYVCCIGKTVYRVIL